MMCVERIDLESGRAILEVVDESSERLEARLVELHEPALMLGLRALEVHSGSASERRIFQPAALERESIAAGEAPIGAPLRAPRIGLELHRATRSRGSVLYEAHFAHRLESCRGIGAYTKLMLCAAGTPQPASGLVRLVVYELCANAIEHGEPLLPETPIQIGLEIGPGSVHGWVRDAGVLFDPLAHLASTAALDPGQRPGRGYGLRIVQRVVDSLHHSYDGRGNLVSFTKELSHDRN
jgi:anti-sigma regulatory factor (Ser/Thr protein kinase)